MLLLQNAAFMENFSEVSSGKQEIAVTKIYKAREDVQLPLKQHMKSGYSQNPELTTEIF